MSDDELKGVEGLAEEQHKCLWQEHEGGARTSLSSLGNSSQYFCLP